MTVASASSWRLGRAWRAVAEVSLLLAALASIVTARAAATRAGFDPLLLGAAFGVGLVVLARTLADRPAPQAAHGTAIGATTARAVAGAVVGVAVGLLIVLVGFGAPALAGLPNPVGLGRPDAAFVPWAAITVLVATAEEAVLRGVLFERLRPATGSLGAVAIAAAAFALLHVPLYGWHVVPLDLAVGVALGGLRVATGTVVAPAVAHAVADLATWWL